MSSHRIFPNLDMQIKKKKKTVIRCDKVQSPVISGLMSASRPHCSDIKPLPHSSYLHVKAVLSCWVSHPSELIFVLTPQQDFHSILKHCKWGLCLTYCSWYPHTRIHTRSQMSPLWSCRRSSWEGSMMVSTPPDLHYESLPPLLRPATAEKLGKKKRTTPQTQREMR